MMMDAQAECGAGVLLVPLLQMEIKMKAEAAP
jgi:hypothetical protein